mgnify:CR=1 FL=1|jgi:hypothetical protein
MDKIKKIALLLDGKGTILVRNESKMHWYIHCWMHDGLDVHNTYTDDLDKGLDVVIQKLRGKKK